MLTHVPDRLTEGYGPNAPALRGACRARRDAGRLRRLRHRRRGRRSPRWPGRRRWSCSTTTRRRDRRRRWSRPSTRTGSIAARACTHLCAAAVAFLAAVATLRALRRSGFFQTRPEPDLLGLLDLVALATVCDVMPLTGLNRALVGAGVARDGAARAARASPRCSRSRPRARAADAVTCGFGLGPRINAAGRISEADLGLRLLLCEDPVEARALAEKLDQVNRLRQQVEAAMLDAGDAGRGGAGGGRARRARWSAGAEWHPGRGRHRRRPHQGAVQPPGLRRRHRRGADEGLGALGARRSISARR